MTCRIIKPKDPIYAVVVQRCGMRCEAQRPSFGTSRIRGTCGEPAEGVFENDREMRPIALCRRYRLAGMGFSRGEKAAQTKAAKLKQLSVLDEPGRAR